MKSPAYRHTRISVRTGHVTAHAWGVEGNTYNGQDRGSGAFITDMTLSMWMERLPSMGKWRAFYKDHGDGEVPAAEAHELIDKFGFLPKFDVLRADRNSFDEGERHFWPKECPGKGDSKYWNSG